MAHHPMQGLPHEVIVAIADAAILVKGLVHSGISCFMNQQLLGSGNVVLIGVSNRT